MDNFFYGESGNVNVMSIYFKKNILNKFFMKRFFEMEVILELKCVFSLCYKCDKNCVGEFGEFIVSFISIYVMLGCFIFILFWSIFCSDELFDFKCDVYLNMRFLFCNERGFLRIIDYIFIKIDF